jgi:hypothetical protein
MARKKKMKFEIKERKNNKTLKIHRALMIKLPILLIKISIR